MKIVIPRETLEYETRVAVVPAMVGDLKRLDADVVVQKGAGDEAQFADKQYADNGATLLDGDEAIFSEADVILKVQPPTAEEGQRLPEGATLISFLDPANNKDRIEALCAKKATVFAMELIPRITRAQSMDALSAMSTVAGYQAVLISTQHFGKFFPLLMTAAGTIPPATVLVLGAGVAGLQAIATARRLGAKVEAFDVRPAVKEQIESLGATFVEMELPEDAETRGGYAKEMSDEFVKKEMEAIGGRLPRTDVVICTAQIFGKRAPLLMTDEMVATMRPGSVIVDIAAEQGGNCALTRAGEIVQAHDVTIVGPKNLPASLPVHASQMYSKTITNLVKHLYQAEDRQLDFEDEITQSACVCHDGELVSKVIKMIMQNGGES
jgi:NAD(P) transhydrogenase subunit alpha